MNKAIFPLLLFLMATSYATGQTMHAIIFANTKSPGNPNNPGDEGIGPSVTVDFQRMGVEMTTIAKTIGYKLKKYYYYDTPERFSRNSLETVLRDLTCSSEDIVFFYYSGHGGRAMNEETIFPEMVLKVPYGAATPSQLYPLYDVYTCIRRKSPRLTIVMGDLCNSILSKDYYKGGNTAKGATVLNKSTYDVYKNLFLNVKGGIIAASSEPNKTSGCMLVQSEGNIYHAGGYMTATFLDVLQYYVGQSRHLNWHELWDTTVSLTQERTKDNMDANGHPSIQTPIYELDIAPVEAPAHANTDTTPNMPIPSNDDATNTRDGLAYSMSMVCNHNIPLMNRMRNINDALTHFAGTNARVQVVGFDNRTIVNTCNAKSYLNYLSMATNMEEVVVLDIQEDGSGKITYAKVHEIHYE